MTHDAHSRALPPDEIEQIFRQRSGRALAALIRQLGDIDLAEDALQDAFIQALQLWPENGIPTNPHAWILRTARHRAIDRLRRESLGRSLLGELVNEQRFEVDPEPANLDALDDDQLRLIFTCCHPALSEEAQVALTLRLLCGLATPDVARAFLVEESTMAQRLVRAKRKIKAAHIPYRVPEVGELPARMPPVLATLYLVYNAGAGHPPGADRHRDELCAEGIRLARLLRGAMPEAVEVSGLLALMLLNESRRKARFSEKGAVVLLRDQDRGQWDSALIEEARELLRECLRVDDSGPYQLQAAIQAVHADAASIDRTDWAQILALYDELLHLSGSPVVAMNRAVAVAEVEGPGAALEAIEGLTPTLKGYYLFHSTRADFLHRCGAKREAREAWERAAELAPTETERRFLRERAESEASDCL